MKEATNIVDFPKSERAKWCGEPGSANINGKITRIICTKPAGHIGEHRWSWEPGPAEPLGSPPDSERVELCGAVMIPDNRGQIGELAFECILPKGHTGEHFAQFCTLDARWVADDICDIIGCQGKKGHKGKHRCFGDGKFTYWSDPTPELCGAKFITPGGSVIVCQLEKGHKAELHEGDGPWPYRWTQRVHNPTPTAFDKAWEEHVKDKVVVTSWRKAVYKAGWQARGKADLEAMTSAVRKPRKERQLYIVDRFGHYVHAYGHNYEIEQAIKKLDTEQ